MKPKTNKKSKKKEPEIDIESLRLKKCKICLNPTTKLTLNFSCNHQLCGICVSHFLIQKDFSFLTDKKTFKLDCPECNVGQVETSLEGLRKILDETFQTRTQKKKDVCDVHKKLGENYCIECKKWLCDECKKLFHDNYFKNHNLVLEVPFELKQCKIHEDKKKDLFCTNCNEEVCHFCSMKGEFHEGHSILTLDDYKNNVLEGKKNYNYKSYEVFNNILTNFENDFRENYINSFNKKKELMDEITKTLKKISEDYLPKFEEKKNFIKNYFQVIRGAYYNYYHDLKIKDPIIKNLTFINSVNK